MPQSEKPFMHIVFQRAANYRTIAANGAWGGISPDGQIVFDLHVDRRASPREMDMFANADGSFREEREPKMQPTIREAQIGVVLAPNVAKSIGEFLIKYASQVLESKQHEDEE